MSSLLRHLRHTDLLALSERLPGLYGQPDQRAVARAFMSCLRDLIAADSHGFVETDLKRGSFALYALDPDLEAFMCTLQPVYVAHCHELEVTFQAQEAYRMSDFFSDRERRALAVYCDYARPADIEHHVAAMTPTGSARFASVAANRGRHGRDFSLRDLAVLEFLKPHLARALRQAELFGQVSLCQKLPLALSEHALRPALWVEARSARVIHATERAGQCLEHFCPPGLGADDLLPEPLRGWLAQRRPCGRAGEGSSLRGGTDLCLRSRWGRLDCHPVEDRASQTVLLLLNWEGPQRPQNGRGGRAPEPERERLTPREREVLGWVGQGKTNAEIAIILGAAPRTVEKHVEHLLAKLGVENRTAAALVVTQDGLAA